MERSEPWSENGGTRSTLTLVFPDDGCKKMDVLGEWEALTHGVTMKGGRGLFEFGYDLVLPDGACQVMNGLDKWEPSYKSFHPQQTD